MGGNNLETRRKRIRSRHDPRSSHATILNRLEISARSDMPSQGSPEVFVSYAWGDKTLDASQEGPPATRKWSKGDCASGPFILRSPDRKTLKKFALTPRAVKFLLYKRKDQKIRPKNLQRPIERLASGPEAFNLWMTKSRIVIAEYQPENAVMRRRGKQLQPMGCLCKVSYVWQCPWDSEMARGDVLCLIARQTHFSPYRVTGVTRFPFD